MKFPRVEAAAAAQADRASLSMYELTLYGFAQPFAFHAIFNGLGAVAFLLLGHPILAAWAFVSYCAVDLVQQALIRRWIPTASQTDEREGFIRIAGLCTARFSVYLAPSVAAVLIGGIGELTLYAVQACTLMAVAMAAGMLSRRTFWAFIAPIVGSLLIVIAAKLTPWQAAGAMLSLSCLAVLLALMLEGTIRTISTLHQAFNANVRMIPELEAARDQAVAERTAANEAREEARQAGRAKANFLATMSHEIRTPMNGVLGMAQLLERDETDPRQKERLSVLIDSGEYLLSILNDVLDVSKIDAGRLDITPVSEDLRLFFDRLVGFWGAQADEKGVSLVLDVAESVPNFALIDALRLRQVLFNLVGNALKFTETGSVAIGAKAMPNGEGAVLLHMTVRDTGIGISPQTLPHLFTRFSQADDSEVRRFGGTGLGLAIAKQLVELMGGRVWADSTLGEGSTFHIKLPLAVAERALETPEAEPAQGAVSPDGLKILAVDDNAVNLLVLDQLLSSMGHRIAKASGGREALEALGREAFDLVLMDIQMPEMTGTEVLQRLREIDGPNRLAPVVALTADVTSGGRKRYLGLGFTEHASKPIQIAELLDAMGRAMAADTRAAQAA
jgi:signal transduction histidine kinase/ActR/RegA family two-component response regulator